MSGNSYIIDTNVISYFLNGDVNLHSYFQNTILHISFITELELKSIPGLSKSDMTKLNTFLSTCIITDINAQIKEFTVRFRKGYKIKLPDAIIAATAMYLGYDLITADESFAKLHIPVILYSK